MFKNHSRPMPENISSPTTHPNKVDKSASHPSIENGLPNDGFIDPERKQIELEESEVRYRRLFETAKDGILILDGNTSRITDVNPFLQDLLGYSKTELMGKALWEIGPVKDISASQEAMRQLQNTDYIRYEDLPLETKAGERKQVEFVSNVYLVDGMRVIQCNIRDITARKQAETRAQTANDELLVLVEELQWRNREMQLLNRMNGLLQSCITQAEAYQVITLNAEELFLGQSGSLAILQPGTPPHFELMARWGTEAIVEPSFGLEDCWALRRGQLHEVLDAQSGLVCRHFTHPPQAGYLCLPLTVQGETMGILCLIDTATRKGKHQLSLQQLAATIGETIKLSLSNLKLRDELRQQATHDPLTGLFNRRYLDETLPRELHMAHRRNSPLCVVMLDIDGFKEFNDTVGHGAGDALLREFGHVIHERLRKSDIACRYGGDEFVLVLPDSSIADTHEWLEQIRITLKDFQIHYGGQVLGMINISAGIAQTPKDGITASEVLRSADKAMYAAKQGGHDHIVIYEKDTTH